MEDVLNEYEQGLVASFVSRLKSATVVRDYKREINNLKKFTDKDIVDINDQDIKNYLESLKIGGKASTTIKRTYSQLNAFFNFLFVENFIDINPFYKVDRPKASEQVKVERTPNPEQLKKLLDTVRTNSELRDYAVILLIATTGIKINDILNIKLNDFTFNTNPMSLNIGQGENIRYIRVLNQVKNVIEEYVYSLSIPGDYLEKPYYLFIRSRDIDKLMSSPHEVKPITKDWIRKVMAKCCKIADIPLFTSKDLRHAHALYAARLGASVDDVANQLGWNDTNLIYKYTGVMEQLLYSANSYTEVFFNQILND